MGSAIPGPNGLECVKEVAEQAREASQLAEFLPGFCFMLLSDVPQGWTVSWKCKPSTPFPPQPAFGQCSSTATEGKQTRTEMQQEKNKLVNS